MRFPFSKSTLNLNPILRIKFFGWLFFIAIAGTCWAQADSQDSRLVSLEVVEAGQKPQYQIDFRSIGRLKIVSRKSSYRMGELISVDVGLFNGGDRSIFVPRLELFAQVLIKNEKNVDMPILMYGIPTFFRSPRTFRLLKARNYDVTHLIYTVGCSSEAKKSYPTSLEQLFESGSFVNRGRGCIDIQTPGKYTITTLIENRLVVVGKGVVHKTAAGIVESEPFEITVE